MKKQKSELINQEVGIIRSLSFLEQIVLMLVYLRHNISFQLLGLIFQVSESTAHNIFTYWQKLCEGELPPSLLEQVKKFQEEESILELLTDYELIVYIAEQPIERPSDYQEQKQYYSGKHPKKYSKKSIYYLTKS
ncbi:hypothetical protein Tery_1408 [Trichodesmium erythraeum IMS101]|uniref:Transposase Helix-turn-helix domain-containing protein n=2 Tax=Trichodesmium erythraeum TaxID=1206 RepID=Q115W8_TRIEI